MERTTTFGEAFFKEIRPAEYGCGCGDALTATIWRSADGTIIFADASVSGSDAR